MFVWLGYLFVCDVMPCHQVIGTQCPVSKHSAPINQSCGGDTYQNGDHKLRGTQPSKKYMQSSMDVTKQCSNEKLKIWGIHSQQMD